MSPCVAPPSVSIVLGTCNGSRWLPALWDSLLAQTRRPDEIVVRDDASEDGTWNLLQTLRGAAIARGVAVKLSRNAHNLGVVGNFAAAMAGAGGDIVFLCDQDDVWHQHKIATHLAGFERRPRLLLLHSDARLIGENGVDLKRSLFDALEISRRELAELHGGHAFDALMRRNLATGATLAFRRELLADAAPFPREWVHDEWLAMMASLRGEVDCIEQALIGYRQHGGNQIGARKRDLAMKWARAGEPRSPYLDGLIARTQILLERLQGLGPPRAPQARIEAVRNKLAHLSHRASMPDCRPCRVPAILREAVSGGYARYATGARAMAYDLFGKD